MTSRLTALAACFAVLATTSLVFAAGAGGDLFATHATAAPSQVVQLERVIVTAKRVPSASR